MDKAPSQVEYLEGSFTNSRGLRLCTSQWAPQQGQPRGLILLCHGYSLNCSHYFQGTATKLAGAGYAVFGIDYEGHGKSEGTRGIVWSLDAITQDCKAFFQPIREATANKEKPKFVVGESLGAGVAQLLLGAEPQDWDGAIFMAPMFIMSEKISPPSWVLTGISFLAHVLPTADLGADLNLAETGNEDPEKRIAFRQDPFIYRGRLRLQTVAALFGGAEQLQANAKNISTPFLVVHGDADVITEAKHSRVLLESAASKDKTLKVYPGMWHLLTEGGPPHKAAIVLQDMLDWLDARST